MITSIFNPDKKFYDDAVEKLQSFRRDMLAVRLIPYTNRVREFLRMTTSPFGERYVMGCDPADPESEPIVFPMENRLKIKTTWSPSRGLDTTETYYHEESE